MYRVYNNATERYLAQPKVSEGMDITIQIGTNLMDIKGRTIFQGDVIDLIPPPESARSAHTRTVFFDNKIGAFILPEVKIADMIGLIPEDMTVPVKTLQDLAEAGYTFKVVGVIQDYYREIPYLLINCGNKFSESAVKRYEALLYYSKYFGKKIV